MGWVLDLEGEEGLGDGEEKVMNELREKEGIVVGSGGGCVKWGERGKGVWGGGVVVYVERRMEKEVGGREGDKKGGLVEVERGGGEVVEGLGNEGNGVYEEIGEVRIGSDDERGKVVGKEIIEMVERK